MKATLYKTLSNEKTPIELQAGKTVKEALPDLDLENAIIVVNGRIEKPAYTLEENDVVMVRLTPAATGVIITAIVAGVVAVAAAITGGVIAYKAKKEAEKAQEELEKVKKLTNKSDIDNRPFLRGASNTLATGNSQPYIIGRHFFTPYLLCSPFYRITGTDGANEYTYTVLECGFNRQIIRKLAIDDIVIRTFADTTPQEGAYNLDTGIFAEDGRIEIAQDGAPLSDMPELNYKTESKACNDQIPHDSDVEGGTEEYLTYTLNPYAKDVDIAITFPYGLYAMNNDGDKIETQVIITPQYSLDGGSSWNSFTFSNNGAATNVFRRNVSTKELRFAAHRDFTAADYNTLKANGQSAIYIRIRSDGKSGDSMIHNDCYCLFYQSVCFDPDKSMSGDTYTSLVPCRVVEDRERAFCTILALKLKATKINEDKLKKINVITQGVARTWDGASGAWSAEKTATRNPAAWALEVLTSPCHPASRYDDSELDLESFGEFYEWCEQQGYRFDWVITQNQKKDDILNYIMEATGACIYYDIYGRRAVAIDRPQENALAVYNPQNIISIQNKKTFGRRTDGLRIKYTTSKDDLFQEDTYLVMREGQTLNQDSIIRDLTVTGVTEYEHIVKYARRLMAVEVLRPKTTTVSVGNEGIFYTPYSKVLIQDDSLKIGIGKGFTIRECVWFGGLLKKIRTNEPLTFDPMKTYGIIVNCFTAEGSMPVALKVDGDGTTNELYVETRFPASADAVPEAGNVFSFGELDIDGEFSKVTTEYLISNIKRSDKGFRLELVNYSEAIYDSGAIPAYRSNITQKASGSGGTIPADSVTKQELSQAVAEAVGKIDPAGSGAAQEAANEVVHGVHFTNIHRIRDMELSLEEILAKIDSDAQEAKAGISISEEEILLYVSDTERELRALIDIQSSAVTALVQGGGAEGRLSLSLELPAMIDAATRAKFVQASSEAEVSAVYARLDGTDYYSIKGSAGKAAVKKLWDKAVSAALLASQIDLSATQINIAGKTIYTSSKTASLANAAQGNAEKTAASLADTAQSNAEATAASQRNEMAQKLGYSSYSDMVSKAAAGQTIIDGGYLRTALIEVENLLAQNITLKQHGFIQSANYAEKNGYPTAGFRLDAENNTIKAYQMKAVGGNFNGITIDTNSVIRGFLQTDNILTKTIAGVYFIDQDLDNAASATNNITMGLIANSNNVKRVVKCGKGKYVIVFTDLDINYGSNVSDTAFSCKVIRCSDSLHYVNVNTNYGAGKYRYGKIKNKCFVQTAMCIRNQTTGKFEVDDASFACITLDANNLPIRGYGSAWYNGGYPEEWLENGTRYWGIGITSSDNNYDEVTSLIGGCQLLIEASRIV